MITIESSGRLGNKLNYFITGMYIHEMKDMYFVPERINGFDKTYDVKDGIRIENQTRISSFIDRSLFSNIKNMQVGFIVDNMIDKYEMIKDIDIKRYLTIENEESYKIPEKDELVIHIRLGDYFHVGGGAVIDKQNYINIINMENPTKCTILTDSPDSDYIKTFVDIGCHINRGSELEDFVYIKNAKKICISNSTFSWTAAYISDAEKIYWPISSNKWPYYQNPGINDADMRTYKNNWILV